MRGWRPWILEDDKVHPYRWLKPDLVAPFLCCDPGLTVDGSGVISDPDRIDEQFRKAWLPFCCRAGRGAVDISAFDWELGGWLPHLGEVDLPPLFGSDLYYVVQHKQASASGLDGWEWRDLKAFLESSFDWLAVVLSWVELDGVWPEGLLVACITLIPKADSDATLLVQRPLCVLLVVHRIWASVGLRHLDYWLKSWLRCSVFSAGGGRGSVEAWYSTALVFEEVLSASASLMFTSLLLTWLSPLTRLIVVFWIWFLGVWGFLSGFVGLMLVNMPTVASGLSLLVVLVRLGLELGVFLKDVRFAWFLQLPCTFLGVGRWSLFLVLGLSCMLIN